ncbi:hypothetical protein JCM33374_g5970 [Metschnikowia sp. JCM 33374]|nr:hypothetical protein JCM33374_g5970 [Metschnikowia sp. JCM 33374]
MVRENRLSYATFEDEIPPEVPVLNGDFDIEKRGHATFMAARRTPDAVEWQTKSFPAAGCIGRISHGIEKANYLSWRVSDLSCKFALFNFNMCMGQRTFDTRGFNVVSDGSRYNHGFKSVFFVCK